jgi:hypothetical protein
MRYYANTLLIYAADEKILDLRFGYSIGDIKIYLDKLGEDGKNYYRNVFHFIDAFYPLIYCAFYLITLGYFVKYFISNRWKHLLLLLPIIGTICDYGENISIDWFIENVNNIHYGSVLLANIFTKIKFISAYGSFILIIVLLIMLIVKKVKLKENGRFA